MITLETWDNKYKPNQDWNHAWGAAPANIIHRYLIGIQPHEPDFRRILIMPKPGSLEQARLKLPTIRKSISVACVQEAGKSIVVTVELPANTRSDVVVPGFEESQTYLLVDGVSKRAQRSGGCLRVMDVGGGRNQFVSKKGP